MRLANRLFAFVSSCGLVGLLAGCGGGAGLAAGSSGETTNDYGNGFLSRGRGAAVIPIPSTGAAMFTAAAGGDIFYLAHTPTLSLFRSAKIVFTSNRAGNDDIFVMDTDGSNLRQLTTDTGQDRNPTITGDGTKVFFESNRNGLPQIYCVNTDGTGEKRLTNNATSDSNPSVTQDGKLVCFTSNRNGNWEIYLMNNDGSGQKRLTNNSKTDDSPEFSPDGSKIVYISDQAADNKRHIWTMSVDGTTQFQVTKGLSPETEPRWSPDMQKILFVNSSGWIYTIKPDGTGVAGLVTGSPWIRYSPVFTPDGQRLLYSVDTTGDQEVYLATAAGANPVRLTTSPGSSDTQIAVSGIIAPTRVYVGALAADGGKDPVFGLESGGFIAGLDPSGKVAEMLAIDGDDRYSILVESLYLGPNAALVGGLISAEPQVILNQDNGRGIAFTQILGPTSVLFPATTNAAELFFNKDTGRLTSVVPISRGRGPGGNGALENGRFVIRGRIAGAIDMTTKRNLAPGGAKEVSIDPRTGQIMGVK